MAERISLKAEPRAVVGKKVRFLRRQGMVPANIYGHEASSAVQLAAKEMEQALSRAGRTHLLTLTRDGDEPTTVLIKDYQRHPIRGTLLHVDFYRVAMTETLRIDVPIRLVGESPAVKQFDGVVFQAVATVSAECLPGDLPEAIEVDMSGLTELDSAVHVRDLPVPSGVAIVADPDDMVVKIMPPTVEAQVDETAAPATAEGATPAESDGTSE